MFAVALITVASIYLAQNMMLFSFLWLESLQEVKRAYSCTYESLNIDLDYLDEEYA